MLTPAADGVTVAGRTVTVFVLACLTLAAQPPTIAHERVGQSDQRPAQGARPPLTDRQPRPNFRAGANFVRVDVYPTADGKPVEGLTAADFRVFEDDVLQVIETFERVRIQASGFGVTPVEPRSVAEANQMAADPMARVFVLFLDTDHVASVSSAQIRRPLVAWLQRLIGPNDLVALMTPGMAAADLMLTRRADRLEAMLDATPFWGTRDRYTNRDPVEQQFEYCYPVDPAVADGHRVTSWVAEEMIARRREVRSLDALEDLVVHLEGLREERKAILLVSEGYARFRPSSALAAASPGVAHPAVPGGRPRETGSTVPRDNSVRGDLAACDAHRVRLANLDNEARFQDLAALANRSSSTFYPVDPRGLAVFDSSLGPNPPPGARTDVATLRARLASLKSLAENTDGLAIVNAKDIEGGLMRVVDDLSSYYLIGYSSTNAKLDGRYREIRVQVQRPGVDVRARRGYLAPTEDEVGVRAAAMATVKPAVDTVTDTIAHAVSELDALRPGVVFRFRVSAGWWTPIEGRVPGRPPGAEPALWVFGEVDVRLAGAVEWSGGGEAQVAILGRNNEEVVAFHVPIAPTGRFRTRFPRSAGDARLDPGSYGVRVRVKAAGGGLPSQDTSRFELPAPPGADRFVMGSPVYYRWGPSTGRRDQVTADLRYRRTDRIAVELSLSSAPDEVTAELLDRNGQSLAVAAPASALVRDDAHWARAEAVLAPLAAGDYVLRITAKKGADQVQMLAAFRVVN